MGLADRAGFCLSARARCWRSSNISTADAKTPFAELPKEVREGFLQRRQRPAELSARGSIPIRVRWKGALHWLRERLNEAPSEKVRVALEELVSPASLSGVQRQAAAVDSLAVRVGGRGIADYTALPIEDAVAAFRQDQAERARGTDRRTDTARDQTTGCAFWRLSGSATSLSIVRRRPCPAAKDSASVWPRRSDRNCAACFTFWTNLRSACTRATIRNCSKRLSRAARSRQHGAGRRTRRRDDSARRLRGRSRTRRGRARRRTGGVRDCRRRGQQSAIRSPDSTSRVDGRSKCPTQRRAPNGKVTHHSRRARKQPERDRRLVSARAC